MIVKSRSGLLTLIPFLSGKTQDEAESFFKTINGNSVCFEGIDVPKYSMMKIKDDWYLSYLIKDDLELDLSKCSMITVGTIKELNDFAVTVKKVIESKFTVDFNSDPIFYVFCGDWTDEEKMYNHVLKMGI
jgi:hypothetical protein